MQMIERDIPNLSIVEQCNLLSLNRSSYYYKPSMADDVDLMNEIEDLHLRLPYYGYRKITHELKNNGHDINHKKVQRLMQQIGLKAIFPSKKPGFDKTKPHKIFPYLLGDLSITTPNQVWSTDITYIRLRHGFIYLVALIDWYSRYIVSWDLDICMSKEFCLEMLDEAFMKTQPKVINTDQGSQFTSEAWINKITNQGVQLSMVGKGRCSDNIMIERFWRSLKYEEVYLQAYDSVLEARQQIKDYINFYNSKRIHQSLGYKTPESVYLGAKA